jgi:hypothetical protein
MVVTNPLDEINDFVLADARDSECSRSIMCKRRNSVPTPLMAGEGTQPDDQQLHQIRGTV